MFKNAFKSHKNELTCLKMFWFQKKQAPNWTYQKKMRYGSFKLQLAVRLNL